MIANYAFLAMFALQILVGSVVAPALFIRRFRPVRPVVSLPADRFAQLFPGVDPDRSAAHLATRYRALNTGIAVLGLLLLAWLFIHMGRPEWSGETAGGKVAGLLTVYLLAQNSPLAFLGWKGSRSIKVLKASLADGKRKASLQRRGLFDFASPLLVFVALFSYVLFVALVLYIRQHPFPGFGGLSNLVTITLLWAFFAFLAYGCLYGRNRFPMATYAIRLHTIGVLVRTFIYTGIATTVFTALSLTLGLLHLQRWELFAVSGFFVICLSVIAIDQRPPPTAPIRPTKHTEISVPAADLDKFVGRYELGKDFVIAVARDGATLWVLRLNAPGYPAPIFPEAPLAFFWKVFDAQLRFTADASGAVTGAELTQGARVFSGNRLEPESSSLFGRPIEYGCGPA
jgi:hypothetical protein